MGKIDLINKIFSSEAELRIINGFKESEDLFLGEVELTASPKKSLFLRVEIPKSYPLSDESISVRFYTSPDSGIAHVNLDGSICIHTPQHHDFELRLKDEIFFLKKWRDNYYIKKVEGERYDYLSIPFKDGSCLLFTNLDHEFDKGEFGEFKYYVFSDHSIRERGISAYQAYILEIGGHKCGWSETVHNLKSSGGFYIFIGDEPIKSPYRIAMDWIELEPYLSKEFLQALYNYRIQSGKAHEIIILVGYSIPTVNGGTEVHWQAISVLSTEIPVYGKKLAPKQYEPCCNEYPIHWIKTINCDYDRYFGRGALSKEFANKRMLIIGVGAIGSSLATILTRSGARFIDICDREMIEPGNICRSEYFLIENQLQKRGTLVRHLDAISPFVLANVKDGFSKRNYGGFESEAKTFLEDYDLVLDCTSDNEVSFFIDELEVSSEVVNISISNEAKEMVLVSGSRITETKKVIFDGFEETVPELIYEGTGCWSPTFKASFFDIHSQLNLLVQNMNHQIGTLGKVRTTVIRRELIENNITLKTIDY